MTSFLRGERSAKKNKTQFSNLEPPQEEQWKKSMKPRQKGQLEDKPLHAASSLQFQKNLLNNLKQYWGSPSS